MDVLGGVGCGLVEKPAGFTRGARFE